MMFGDLIMFLISNQLKGCRDGLLFDFNDLLYSERFSVLGLPSLQYCHLWGDLTLIYRMVNNNFGHQLSEFFSMSIYNSTRGHPHKFFSQATWQFLDQHFSSLIFNSYWIYFVYFFFSVIARIALIQLSLPCFPPPNVANTVASQEVLGYNDTVY